MTSLTLGCQDPELKSLSTDAEKGSGVLNFKKASTQSRDKIAMSIQQLWVAEFGMLVRKLQLLYF